MKIYKLEFLVEALREWEKLDGSIKGQFKKQLEKRLISPHVPSAILSGDLEGYYKIKLRTSGYRLVYEVIDRTITVMVIVVGRRDKNEVYIKASKRILNKYS